MKYLCLIMMVAALFIGVLSSVAEARKLATDEEIVFFPSALIKDPVTDAYYLNIHGWVFEPEIVGINLALFKKMVELEDVEDSDVLKRRAGWFLTDNERGKDIYIRVGGQSYRMPKTAKNGHFQTSVALSEEQVAAGIKRIRAILPDADARQFTGEVIEVFPAGIGVISDIDDTIKISNVLDKSALLKNTFQREFQSVAGMSGLYRAWRDASAQINFYYVSSSPWQLYPELAVFMKEAGFPKGLFYLKTFRWKDRSFFQLFTDPIAYKVGNIEEIISQTPQKKFILVGDSGEKDPEVYAAILKKYPDNIIAIYIRDVTGNKALLDARMTALLKDKQNNCHWQSFTDPQKIDFQALHPLLH